MSEMTPAGGLQNPEFHGQTWVPFLPLSIPDVTGQKHTALRAPASSLCSQNHGCLFKEHTQACCSLLSFPSSPFQLRFTSASHTQPHISVASANFTLFPVPPKKVSRFRQIQLHPVGARDVLAETDNFSQRLAPLTFVHRTANTEVLQTAHIHYNGFPNFFQAWQIWPGGLLLFTTQSIG